MKPIWLAVTVLFSTLLSSSSSIHFEAVQPMAEIKAEGLVLRETLTPLSKPGCFQVTVQLECSDEWAAIQQAHGQKEAGRQMVRQNPLVVYPKEQQPKTTAFPDDLWRLKLPLCADIRLLEAEEAWVYDAAEHTLYWDMDKALRSGDTKLCASFCICVPSSFAYRTKGGHIIQMQTRFAYIQPAQQEGTVIQRLYVPSPKVRASTETDMF